MDEPATLKLKTRRVSEYWITEGLAWDCRCPYCRRFNAAHPPDIEGARRWWRAQDKRRLKNYDMHSKSELPRYLPLLGFHEDDALSKEAALARVGPNHWELDIYSKFHTGKLANRYCITDGFVACSSPTSGLLDRRQSLQ